MESKFFRTKQLGPFMLGVIIVNIMGFVLQSQVQDNVDASKAVSYYFLLVNGIFLILLISTFSAMFSVVYVTDKGMEIKLFGKTQKFIKWDEIADVKYRERYFRSQLYRRYYLYIYSNGHKRLTYIQVDEKRMLTLIIHIKNDPIKERLGVFKYNMVR